MRRRRARQKTIVVIDQQRRGTRDGTEQLYSISFGIPFLYRCVSPQWFSSLLLLITQILIFIQRRWFFRCTSPSNAISQLISISPPVAGCPDWSPLNNHAMHSFFCCSHMLLIILPDELCGSSQCSPLVLRLLLLAVRGLCCITHYSLGSALCC